MPFAQGSCSLPCAGEMGCLGQTTCRVLPSLVADTSKQCESAKIMRCLCVKYPRLPGRAVESLARPKETLLQQSTSQFFYHLVSNRAGLYPASVHFQSTAQLSVLYVHDPYYAGFAARVELNHVPLGVLNKIQSFCIGAMCVTWQNRYMVRFQTPSLRLPAESPPKMHAVSASGQQAEKLTRLRQF